MKKIVLTGGHHSSALPVIDELKRRYPNVKISWIGHKYSMQGDKSTTLEFREITSLNIDFYDLKAGKFYRTFNPIRILKIPFGFVQAFYFLLKIRPEKILSFGGYLAVPVVIAGWFLRIKSVTHEQTVVVGYANKLISRFATKILVSWPQSKDYFKNKDVVETGIPLRDDIFVVKSDEFKVVSALPTIYITAGKTGSVAVNKIIFEALEDLLENYNVIHQTGDHSVYNDYEKIQEKYLKIKQGCRGKYFAKKFVYAETIGEAFSKANLVITRAGAHICSELIALNKPALLIPISWVSHNEQFKNAQMVANAGLGEVLEEKDLSLDSFKQEVDGMMSNLSKYKGPDKTQITNSAKLIVDEIEKI